jgi:sulfofructosephosphate aldolase
VKQQHGSQISIKLKAPFHGEGDLNLVTKNAERISEAIGSPWVVLSNGVKQPFFNDAVKACAMGGASGFLAGSARCGQISLDLLIFQKL